VNKFREFNTGNVLNENEELPDCSGGFNPATNLYTDIIGVGLDAFALTFELTDSINLDFTLLGITVVETPPPNEPPAVNIADGDKNIVDTDEAEGESVSFSATATDSDGTVTLTEWLIEGTVVATGLTPNIALPDGATVVTFRATDDDEASSSTNVTITVEAPPPSEWPFPYNGVTPDESLGLDVNNIGIFNPDDGFIYSCLRILTNGLPGSEEEDPQFGVGFELVPADEFIIRLIKFKDFNPDGVLNENGELPDCNGVFETTTLIYTDTIQVGLDAIALAFELIASDYLDFRLIEVTLLQPSP